MQATVHAHIQLTAAASHDKLSVPFVAHVTLKMAMFDLGKLSAPLMLALVSATKLLLHLNDTAPSLRWKHVGRCASVYDLFSASDQILFDPERAFALTWVSPFCST